MSTEMPLHRYASLPPSVVIGATLDTKSEEVAFLRAEVEKLGLPVIVIDCGILGAPSTSATIDRAEIARRGGADIEDLRRQRNRETGLAAMLAGFNATMAALVSEGRVVGYVGIGGGTNAALAAEAFRVMPYGIPKLLVSTIAAGDTRPIVDIKDVVLMHSVVDVLGLNGFLEMILRQAATILAAMVRSANVEPPKTTRRRVVGLTAYGATTAAAMRAHHNLTERGCEVLSFHARGIGGRAMEAMIREGRIEAVLDLTTTEVADEIAGGINSAGAARLDAAAEAGIPQVILPGAIDIVNFGPRIAIPLKYADRTLVSHTPFATLMRSNANENAQIGTFIARKLNAARGPVGIVIPLHGYSSYDAEGGPFFDPAADTAFRDALTGNLRGDIVVKTVDAHINSPTCVDLATNWLLDMMVRTDPGRAS